MPRLFRDSDRLDEELVWLILETLARPGHIDHAQKYLRNASDRASNARPHTANADLNARINKVTSSHKKGVSTAGAYRCASAHAHEFLQRTQLVTRLSAKEDWPIGIGDFGDIDVSARIQRDAVRGDELA